MLSHSSEMGGGAERSMIDFFDYWVKNGDVDPHFIIRIPLKNMVQELDKRNWRYYPVHYTNWSQRNLSRRAEDVFRNGRENAKAFLKIEKIIKDIKPDIVMTNTIVSPWAALAAYFQRVPHVWFVREFGDADHKHIFEMGREKMFEDIGIMSDLVVTNSKTLGTHVKQYIGDTAQKILYTPFDLDNLNKRANEPAKNPFKHNDSLKLVVTGRIAPSKGQHEVAKAVGELNNKGINTELCLVGKHVEEGDIDKLNAVIEQYDIQDKVHLVGHQSNPLSIVKFADVGVTPSKREAFGRVTFEYMAIGLPVVGTNAGATPEIIDDGKSGFLYRKDSASSLATQLKKYAQNRELIEQHGKAARLKTQNMMNGEHNAQHMIDYLEKMVGDNSLQKVKYPLNFSYKWVQYPIVAQKYIDETKVIAFKKLFKKRLRGKLRHIYIRTSETLHLRKKNAD